MRSRSLVLVVCATLWGAACSDPEKARIRETTKPTYDKATGRLTQLTYDANKNGKVDTWTDMDGTRPQRSRTDLDEDGKIDRWEYYDGTGALTKVGFSRKQDGTPDAGRSRVRTAKSPAWRFRPPGTTRDSIAGSTTRRA